MSHCLIRQTKDKKRQRIGIVIERIGTTTPCSLTEETQHGGECGGKVNIPEPLGSKVE